MKNLEDRVREMGAELSEVNEKLERRQKILSALDTGLSVINPDRTVAWVNEKMRQMYPGQELVDCICHVCFDASAVPCNPCPMLQCFLTGKIHQIDQFNPVTQNWLHIVSQPIKDADGQEVKVLEAIRNVTERKRIEQTEKEALEMFRLAMESADEGVLEWYIDTDADPAGVEDKGTSAFAIPEDGIHRHAGRGRRPRFQQYPDADLGIHGNVSGGCVHRGGQC